MRSRWQSIEAVTALEWSDSATDGQYKRYYTSITIQEILHKYYTSNTLKDIYFTSITQVLQYKRCIIQVVVYNTMHRNAKYGIQCEHKYKMQHKIVIFNC